MPIPIGWSTFDQKINFLENVCLYQVTHGPVHSGEDGKWQVKFALEFLEQVSNVRRAMNQGDVEYAATAALNVGMLITGDLNQQAQRLALRRQTQAAGKKRAQQLRADPKRLKTLQKIEHFANQYRASHQAQDSYSSVAFVVRKTGLNERTVRRYLSEIKSRTSKK